MPKMLDYVIAMKYMSNEYLYELLIWIRYALSRVWYATNVWIHYEVYDKCILGIWVITRVTKLCKGIESELVDLIWSDEGLETLG